MQVNMRKLLEQCIDDGMVAGINRAFKHTDTPPPEYIVQCMNEYIWLEIDEYFLFTDLGELQEVLKELDDERNSMLRVD